MTSATLLHWEISHRSLYRKGQHRLGIRRGGVGGGVHGLGVLLGADLLPRRAIHACLCRNVTAPERSVGPTATPGGIRSVTSPNLPDMPNHREGTGGAIRRNIEAVRKLEEEFTQRRTFSDRVADTIGGFAGHLPFAALHAVWIAGWLRMELLAPQPWQLGPFPFILLSVMVSCEAIFLSTFVLMKQNRMSKREDLRAHLDLQVNLLSEREMTLVLQLLQRISTRLGVRLSGGRDRRAFGGDVGRGIGDRVARESARGIGSPCKSSHIGNMP